jgi:hypothetical protein
MGEVWPPPVFANFARLREIVLGERLVLAW